MSDESRRVPQRPPGRPPARIPTLGTAAGSQEAKSSSGLTLPANVKRPPGAPPGLPPSKRLQASGAAADQPKDAKAKSAKPPPASAPPVAAVQRGGRAVEPAPPSKPPPSAAGGASPLRAEEKPPPRGKAPPPAKSGGRPPPKGLPPGSGAVPAQRGDKPAPTEALLAGGREAQAAGQPPPPDDPFHDEAVAEVKTSDRQRGGRPSPPGRSSRPPPPMRPPPGAPPGKPPPPSAPPGAAGEQVAKSPYGPPTGRRRPPGAPPGRAPPPGLPPGQRPPPPSSRPPSALGIYPAPRDDISDDSSVDEDTVEAPEAPPPPLEAPPEGLEDEPMDDEAPAPPMEAPPSLGQPGVPDGPAHIKVLGDIDVGSLPPGRLTLKLLQGHNIRKAGQSAGKTKVDACVTAQLGKHKKAPRFKSRVIKKANEQPNFNGEVITFDVLNVAEFVQGGDIIVTLELLDENTFSNGVLGHLELSIVQFMRATNSTMTEKFPLVPPEAQRDIFKMDLEMEVCYKPSIVGMLLLTLYEGRQLKNPDLLGKQDPYLQFQIGEKYKKQSKTIVDGGDSPYFKEEQVAMWVDQRNWVHDLTIEAWDKDVGTDDLIGQTRISLIDLMNEVDHPDLQQERLVELFSKDGARSHGHVLLKPQFLPAGNLKIHVHEAKHLREISTGGRQDPYIAFTVDGAAVQIQKKTKVDTDGGLSPVWDEVVTLQVVDHYQLEVACWDHDLLAEDQMVGKCTVSLLPMFKTGLVDTWVTLMSPNAAGIQQPAGDLHLSFDFDGRRGVGYPQNVEGVDSFDETHRVQEARRKEAEAEKKKAEALKRGIKLEDADMPSRLATDLIATAEAPQRPRDTTFTDSEIEAAFHFLDLDKNGYIGAAEIRHVLICMGELITDEEVDMMISMVDSDGDGQVSYAEFYELVTDPDPSRPDFGKHGVTDEKVEAKINPAAQMQRQREAAAREEKRSMLGSFVKDNSIGMAEVKFAFDTFMALPAEKRKQGIDFKLFCKLMRVESTGEYHRLFTLFDSDNSGDVDIKELILGLLNFVDSGNKAERCDYIFRVYDEDNSGFIDIEELISILSANHMQSRDAVKKKAATIMRTADADGSGELSMDEFRVVAEKFPNILFPASA